MENKMTIEQYFPFIWDQITALMYICGILVSTHPKREDIIQLIKTLPKYPNQDISSEYYRDGIKRVVEELESLLKTALFAEQCASLKPGKDN